MIYSQKYTIVQFLEPVQDQQVFSIEDWPLHITLADVFAVELTETLFSQLTTLLDSQDSLVVEAGDDANLGGSENPTKVTLLRNTAKLQSLHTGLVDLLQENGAIFNSPQFTREGFLPHSAHQKHAQLARGQQVTINELSLVDMFVDKDWRQRKVLRIFKLKA